MKPVWRLLDTGLRPAAENIALNQALLAARQAGEAPASLRFLRFQPCALLGFHQSAAQELNLAYCRARDIAVQRRITGGGAIYFDPGQLGWELYLRRGEIGGDMQAISRRICEAAAAGMRALGVEARYRPRNDIEVDGRKLSGTGGVFDGDALLYQGTLLLEFDVERMLRVLRIPAEKLTDKAIASARERVVSLAELLGAPPSLADAQAGLGAAFAEAFGVEFAPGEINAAESARYRAALAEIDSPEWLAQVAEPAADLPIGRAARKFAAGLLHAAVAWDRRRGRIRRVWFSGDLFIQPRRTLADLEAGLRDLDPAGAAAHVRDFFAARPVDMLGLTADDFVAVLDAAVAAAAADATG